MKRKIVTILAYTLLVAVVLLLSQCERGVTLTTVKRDAQHIIELAQRIESEEELKHVEKLARQYEIGYQRMYNGAKALEFKRLTNEALREASIVCDQIHAEKERKAAMRNTFNNSLEDLEAAWCHNVASKDEDLAKIASNNEQISTIEANIAAVEREVEDLAMRLIEAGYPEAMLAELGALKDKVAAYQSEIENIENSNRIIRLAYKLRNIELEVVAEAEEGIENEVVAETVESIENEYSEACNEE